MLAYHNTVEGIKDHINKTYMTKQQAESYIDKKCDLMIDIIEYSINDTIVNEARLELVGIYTELM